MRGRLGGLLADNRGGALTSFFAQGFWPINYPQCRTYALAGLHLGAELARECDEDLLSIPGSKKVHPAWTAAVGQPTAGP